MIPHLSGWQQERQGELVTLIPPEGPRLGGIRYLERVRRVARVDELVRELLAAHPGFTEVTLGAPEELVTREGEHAALVTARGKIDGVPAQRDFGFVLTEDFHARTSSACLDPGHFARFTDLVRQLVVNDVLALGVRRRAVRHQGPPGWRRDGFGLQTSWSDAGAVITVFPANPLAVAPDPWLAFENLVELELARGFRVSGHRGPFALPAHHRLEGCAWELTGSFPGEPERTKQIAVLSGDRYVYTLQLDVVGREPGPAVRVFHEVARSIEPVPAPEGTRAPVAEMAHWLE